MCTEFDKIHKSKNQAIIKGNWKAAADDCNYLGSEYFKLKDFQTALECHQEELELCTKHGDQLGIAIAHRKIGECYSELFKFDKALSHTQLFLEISNKLNSLIEKQRALATLGRIYYFKYLYELEQGKQKNSCSECLDQAKNFFNEALELAEELKQSKSNSLTDKEYAEMRARLYLNLGLVYEQKNDLIQCAEHIKNAIVLSMKHNLNEDLNRCQYSLASVYESHGKYESAIHLLDGAFASSKTLKDKSITCEVLFSKAKILTMLKNFEEAKLVLKKAYKLHSPIESDHEKITKNLKRCIGLCIWQKKLEGSSDVKEKKNYCEKIADNLSLMGCYKPAIDYYRTALNFLKDYNAPLTEFAPIYFSIAQTYLDDGNKEKSIEYFKKEFKCNENNPSEQVKTLLKIADIRETQEINEHEKYYYNALSLAENTKDDELIILCLKNLKIFYEKKLLYNKSEEIIKKLQELGYNNFDSEESDDEDNSEAFDDIHLSEMSDFTDSDSEKETIISRTRRQSKKLESKVNEKGETPLHQACINGNLVMVKRLVESGHMVNIRDFCGWLPLHEACNHGYYDIVEYLLEKGAAINDRGGTQCAGITPLHDAASCGNLDVIQLLISKGANVIALDDQKQTPLDALINWKKRSKGELDAVTLKQCKVIEDELKIKMAQAGYIPKLTEDTPEQDFPSTSIIDLNETVMSSPEIHSHKSDKRSRSPSLSSDYDSEDDHLHFLIDKDNWNEAENAQSEYKSVMSNLRRSAKTVISNSFPHCEPRGLFLDEPKPSLINESEVKNEWLIKDTNKISKVKRKQRKKPRLNIRTSKSINNYLIPQNSNQDNMYDFIGDEDAESNVSISSNDSNQHLTIQKSQEKIKSEESVRQSFCLRVRIENKLILVPVTSDTATIGWLCEEAAQRYQNLIGNLPHLTLMTKDGALLSNSDFIKTILENNEEVASSIEYWEEPSLEERYIQVCKKRNLTSLSYVKTKLHNFETTAELNFSNNSIPSPQLNAIFNSLQNYKNLQLLDISGIMISEANMNELILCFPSFISLQTLNLSCCCLTIHNIKEISNYFHNQYTIENKLPSLHSLNLSYNSFGPATSAYLGHILLELESIRCLNLSSCSITSSFFSNTFCQNLQSKFNLQELQISRNFLGAAGITELLKFLPKTHLTKLDFSYTVQTDITFRQYLKNYLAQPLPCLKELSFQGCYINDSDIECLSELLNFYPQLISCDISENPCVTSDSICNLINSANYNKIKLKELYLTGITEWNYHSLSKFTKTFKLNILKQIRLDAIPDDLQMILFDAWKSAWGDKVTIISHLYCELSCT